MLKHIAALLVFSTLILMAMPQAQIGLHVLLAGHDWVAETLKQVFSPGIPGNLIRELLALLAIPVLVGLIPSILYWLVRREWMPYFFQLVWVTWLIQTAALVIQYTPVHG
ncbi:MAG: hypothetical protein P4M12_00285 [Gammaproteobacteria bacterium]|nr:hypothetical protein [Gammaproteobacteria bacterium]